MSEKSSRTPKGTPPLETRRSTKHKRPSYGRELIAKAQARRIRRTLAAEKLAKAGAPPSEIKPAMRPAKPQRGGLWP